LIVGGGFLVLVVEVEGLVFEGCVEGLIVVVGERREEEDDGAVLYI